jgi:hypothetical protein
MLDDKKIIIYPEIGMGTAAAILGWYKRDVAKYEMNKPGRSSVLIYTIKTDPDVSLLVYFTKTAVIIRRAE